MKYEEMDNEKLLGVILSIHESYTKNLLVANYSKANSDKEELTRAQVEALDRMKRGWAPILYCPCWCHDHKMDVRYDGAGCGITHSTTREMVK